MTQTYRTNDGTRWGAGVGRRLSPTEVDINFWDVIQRLLVLEALPGAPAAIDHFEVSGTNFYVHLTDSTILGPYPLPMLKYRYRGDWASNTMYEVLDTFTVNASLYVTNVDHESEDTFDPGANDGNGHDYYSKMLEAPGAALPEGGAVGQVLKKSSVGNFLTTWAWIFPSGVAGRFLQQRTNAQDDVEFVVPEASEIHLTPATASNLSDGTVADALEELASGGPIDSGGIPFTPVSGNGIAANNVQDAINELADSAGTGGSAGKQTMWIPAGALIAMLTDGATPGLIETSSHKNMVKTMDFSESSFVGAQFDVAMPKSWDKGEISFRVFWSHDTTSLNFDVSWFIYANTIATTGGDLDSNINDTLNFFSTGGVPNGMYVSAETDPLEIVDASSSVAAVDDNPYFIMQIWRDGGGSGDTLAVAARLHGIQIYYTTTAGTDD